MDQLSMSTTLTDLDELLRMDGPFAAVADRIVEVGTTQLAIGHGHLTKIIPELNHWEVIATTDEKDGVAPLGLTRDLQATFCRQAVVEEDILLVHDAPNQPEIDESLYAQSDLRCYVSSPVEVDGEIYGTLCFASKHPRSASFRETEIVFLDCLVSILETTLERRRNEITVRNQSKLVNIFSRIMRHNLRNDLGIVRGHVDLLLDQPETDPSTITLTLDKLLALADKSRQLKSIVEHDATLTRCSITSMLRRAGKELLTNNPASALSFDIPGEVQLIAFPTVETALYELLENAVKHSSDESESTVTVDSTVESVSITVTDQGSGLPDQEQRVLRGGSETELSHGSGVGLWIVRWVVESHDGEISVATDGTGTSIRTEFPRVTANENLIKAG